MNLGKKASRQPSRLEVSHTVMLPCLPWCRFFPCPLAPQTHLHSNTHTHTHKKVSSFAKFLSSQLGNLGKDGLARRAEPCYAKSPEELWRSAFVVSLLKRAGCCLSHGTDFPSRRLNIFPGAAVNFFLQLGH